MNKNFKVITINGIRGIIVAIFVVMGLIAGFIISPGWVCMKIWNLIFDGSNTVALMNLFQGIILWAIIALSLYAINNRRSLIGFGSYSYPVLSPDQIKDIMERAKKSDLNIQKNVDDIFMSEDIKELNKENSTEINNCEKSEEVNK